MWLRKRGRCLWKPMDCDFIYLIQLICVDEHSRERAGYSWARFFANIFHLVTCNFCVVITRKSPAHSVGCWDVPKGNNSSKYVFFNYVVTFVLDTRLNQSQCSMFVSKLKFQSLLICTGFNQWPRNFTNRLLSYSS